MGSLTVLPMVTKSSINVSKMTASNTYRLWFSPRQDMTRIYEGRMRREANAYLLKPVEFTHFTEIIRQLSTFWMELIELPPDVDV